MVAPTTRETGPVIVEKVHTGKVVGISIIAALGGFLFGYDSSVINGANKAVFYQFQIENTSLQGFVVAIALLGSAVGAFFGGRLADKIGRKKVMVIAAILFLIAGVGQAFPFSVGDFMLWRVVGGFAIGLAAVISPMYISEVAPAHFVAVSPHCSNWQSWSASSPLSWSTRSSSPWFPTQFRSR